MNRTSMFLALALLLGATTVAGAQDATPTPPTPQTTSAGAAPATGSIWIGGTAGFSMPFGDFADVANVGFNIGIIGDYYAAPNWAFGGEISWHTFGGNDDLEKGLSADLGVPVDFEVRVLPIVGHVKYLIPAENMSPFARAGIGIFNLNFETEAGTESSDDSETKLGFLLGGGVTFLGSRVTYGGEAFYQYIATEGDATNMLVIRGNFMFGVR